MIIIMMMIMMMTTMVMMLKIFRPKCCSIARVEVFGRFPMAPKGKLILASACWLPSA